MPVDNAKIIALSQAADPKTALAAAIGDLSGIEVFHNQILVATYFRPEKTAGGIIRPQSNVKEDEYQGKVGLVMKLGPTAFMDGYDASFQGQSVSPGDWLVYRVGDGWQLTINGVPCRILTDRNVRLRVAHPDMAY